MKFIIVLLSLFSISAMAQGKPVLVCYGTEDDQPTHKFTVYGEPSLNGTGWMLKQLVHQAYGKSFRYDVNAHGVFSTKSDEFEIDINNGEDDQLYEALVQNGELVARYTGKIDGKRMFRAQVIGKGEMPYVNKRLVDLTCREPLERDEK